MRARTLAIVAMLCLADTAPAGEHLVYRCRDATTGHLSFQSQPCGRGQAQEATYDATPDEVTTWPGAGKQQRSAARPMQQSTGRGRGSTRTRARAVAAVIGSSAECKRVRAARDKAYRADHKMGYRAREKWGDRVRKACE